MTPARTHADPPPARDARLPEPAPAGPIAAMSRLAAEIAAGAARVLDALPVVAEFDPHWPGTVVVGAGVAPDRLARELYGTDVSASMEEVGGVPGTRRYLVIQELLTSAHRARFAAMMRELLGVDVQAVEDILFETRIDGSDEATLVEHVRRWADRRDLRDPAGRSWFDVFLGRLHDDRWYRDYGLWEGARTRYLDTLYSEVEERAGELHSIIAANSMEFGAYRPVWAALDVEGRPKPGGVTFVLNESLVRRASELVRDGDSTVVADVLVGLPAPELAAVLRDVTSHYDDRTAIGLGRYGEAWEGGMLYRLFERLDDGDRGRVAAAVTASGVLPPDTVTALAAGRTWAGRNMPWTTRKGEEAAQFWADVAVHSDSTAGTVAASIMGGFASLWTPETAGATALTLISAGAANPGTGAMAVIGQASPLAGQALTLTGTFATSFNVTIAVQNVVTDTDVWTGRPLGPGERLSQGLVAASGVLTLGASFAAAATPAPAAPAGPTPPTGRLTLVYSAPAAGPVGPPPQTRFLYVAGSGGTAAALKPMQLPSSVPAPTLKPAPLSLVPAPAPLAAVPVAPPAAGGAVAGAIGTAAATAAQPGGQPPQPRVPSGKLPGDPRDHIPIVWLKHPDLYPDPIRLIDAVGVPHDFAMTEPHQQIELGYMIGVVPANLPEIGKSVQLRWNRGMDDRPNADLFRAVLLRHGWTEGDTHQIDHVQELMWSGEDLFDNLWPLDTDTNTAAGRGFMNMRVTYSNVPGGGPPTATTTNVRIGAGMDALPPDNLVGRWFVIRGYRRP